MNRVLSSRNGSYYCVYSESAALQALRQAIRNVPLYRAEMARLEASGVSLLELLAAFPIFSKSDLLSRGEDLFDLGIQEAVVISETSGTTGRGPLVTPRSNEELRWNARNLAHAFDSMLTRKTDRVAIVHPGLMSPFAEACGIALMQLGVPFLRIFPIPQICDYHRIARVLRDYNITTIMTTPTLAAKTLYEIQAIGDDGGNPVRKLLLTGEHITDAGLANFSKMIGGMAWPFVYGSSEAATCMHGCENNAYHPYWKDFLFEFRPVAGVTEAAVFELVVTWLNRGVRPLIRYATGDLFTLIQNCPCRVGGFSVKSAGSIEKGASEAKLANEIAKAVFAMSPVFHHSLKPAGAGDEKTLSVIVSKDREVRVVRDSIAASLAELGQRSIQVEVNPMGHPFYDFSPQAKTSYSVARN